MVVLGQARGHIVVYGHRQPDERLLLGLTV